MRDSSSIRRVFTSVLPLALAAACTPGAPDGSGADAHSATDAGDADPSDPDAGGPPEDAGPEPDVDAGGPAADGGGPFAPLPADVFCDVQALLSARCASCHTADGAPPDLTFPAVQDHLVGADATGGWVTPGDVEGSALYRSVASLPGDAQSGTMPPPPAAPLNPTELALLASWIDAGATDRCAPGQRLQLRFEEGEGQLVTDHAGSFLPAHLGSTTSIDTRDPSWTTEGARHGALHFDGFNDQVRLDDEVLNPSFTFSAWIRPLDLETDSDTRVLFSTGPSGVDVRIDGDGVLSAGRAGGLRVRDEDAFVFKSVWNRAQWWYVAASYQAATHQVVLYREGVRVGQVTLDEVPVHDAVRLGRSPAVPGAFFGELDEVRIYDLAQGDQDIADAFAWENAFVPPAGPPDCSTEAGLALYTQRIEPLVTGGQPATCNQCHLSGVELSAFVQDTPCDSMACLVDQGLVDLDAPEGSPILEQILLADPDSWLITDEVIQAEHDGFLEWIAWSSICQEGACGVIEDPCGLDSDGGVIDAPPVDSPVLGACAEQSLVVSFSALVYSKRSRCQGCHDPDGQMYYDEAPMWVVGGGDLEGAKLTMFNVIGLGAVDTDTPEQSLLLLKPLAEQYGGVEHGGGAKFHGTLDPAYQSFLSWLNQYAACFDDDAADVGVLDGGAGDSG